VIGATLEVTQGKAGGTVVRCVSTGISETNE
jgi:hypothetical protein